MLNCYSGEEHTGRYRYLDILPTSYIKSWYDSQLMQLKLSCVLVLTTNTPDTLYMPTYLTNIWCACRLYQ